MLALKTVSDEQAQSLVDRAEVLGIVEQAYRASADGQARVSEPAALSMRGPAGTGTAFKVKGAVLDTLNVAGFRLIADGAQASQETGANLYLIDATNGRPLGFVAEAWLHRIRTASTGLVTCRQLLPRSARRLALIGTGRIAQEFVRSCHLVLPQVEIVMASRSAERAKANAEAWRELTPLPLSAAPISEALSQADVVVTLSDAAEVLFAAAELQPHALVCAMGGRFEIRSRRARPRRRLHRGRGGFRLHHRFRGALDPLRATDADRTGTADRRHHRRTAGAARRRSPPVRRWRSSRAWRSAIWRLPRRCSIAPNDLMAVDGWAAGDRMQR